LLTKPFTPPCIASRTLVRVIVLRRITTLTAGASCILRRPPARPLSASRMSSEHTSGRHSSHPFQRLFPVAGLAHHSISGRDRAARRSRPEEVWSSTTRTRILGIGHFPQRYFSMTTCRTRHGLDLAAAARRRMRSFMRTALPAGLLVDIGDLRDLETPHRPAARAPTDLLHSRSRSSAFAPLHAGDIRHRPWTNGKDSIRPPAPIGECATHLHGDVNSCSCMCSGRSGGWPDSRRVKEAGGDR